LLGTGLVLAAGLLAVVPVVLLALNPRLVLHLRELDSFQAVGITEIVTDLDQGGSLTALLRVTIYLVLCLGVVSSSVLGAAASLRGTGNTGVRSLATFLSASALGLSCLYVVALLLPDGNGDGVPDLLTLVEVLGTGALGISAGALLNFTARFPFDLPAGRFADRYAERRKVWRLEKSWPFFRVVSKPPPGQRLDRQTALRTLRIVNSSWLPLASGFLFGIARVLGPGPAAMVLWTAFLTIPGGAYLLVLEHHQVGDEASRFRLTWILGGFTLAVWAWVVLGLLPFGLGPLLGGVGYGLYMATLVGLSPSLIYAIIVASLAMATFYHGAIDPNLAIRRSTFLGFTVVVFVAVFGGIENVVSEWVEGRMGMPGIVGSALTGAVLAVVLLPFQGPAKRLARRLEPSFLDSKEPPRST
jgi:hypothetical protein